MAKKKRFMTRTPAALVKAEQKVIFDEYASGKTIEQIAETMKTSRGHVRRAINIAMNDLITQFAMPTPEQNFVRYAAFQFRVLSKLQDCLERFLADPQATQYNSAVSALRAQSDIYDKIVDKGEHYGVIQKKKAKDSVRKGPAGLRTELRQRIRTLTVLLSEVDEYTEYRSKRHAVKSRDQPQQHKRTSHRATQTDIVYVARIRKVQRNAFGVVRSIPDWKYRTEVYNTDGTRKPKRDYAPEDHDRVAAETTRAKHDDILTERERLAIELERERSKSATQTDDTSDLILPNLRQIKAAHRRYKEQATPEHRHTVSGYLVEPTRPSDTD